MKARNKRMPTGLIIVIVLCIVCAGYGVQAYIIDSLQKKCKELNHRLSYAQKESDTLFWHNAHIKNENAQLKSENKDLKAALAAESAEPEPVEEVNPLLPPQDIPTNIYRCEPFMIIDLEKSDDTETVYKSAFSKNSEQAALQEDCFTDIETGIRYYFDTSDGTKWHCAALAGAYGIEIGHCYIFTLANGTELPVMLADFKHDINDPKPDDYGDDDINYDGEKCVNVIEFVVDMPTVPKAAREAGTMSALDKFGGLYGHDGNIVDVKDVGRRWKA